MGTRLSADARRLILTWAAEEAGRRGDRRIGTDHLLLGILHESTSDAAEALGVDLASARAADERLDRAVSRPRSVSISAAVRSPRARHGRAGWRH